MGSTPVILATTNGSGMGHLARQSAIALALREKGHDPLLFSLSTALPLALSLTDQHGQALRGQYCRSYSTGWIPRPQWQHYYQRNLQQIVEQTGAQVVVFDGVVPYPGLLRARRALPQVKFCWCRRGMWQPGLRTWALRAVPFFDAVLEPGDFAAPADRGATASAAATRVAPISLASMVDQLPRQHAANALGLDPQRPTALVTLPFAAAEGIAAAVEQFVAAGWQVALTQGPIGGTTLPEHVVVLRGVFPLVRYLAAFDAAVAAAGYNAVHELLAAAVPTVLIPRTETRTDDQHARASWLGQQGYALHAQPDNPEAIREAIASLTDAQCREQLHQHCLELPSPTGSTQAAQQIVALAARPTLHRTTMSQRTLLAALSARDGLEASIGSGGIDVLRRLTGHRRRE